MKRLAIALAAGALGMAGAGCGGDGGGGERLSKDEYRAEVRQVGDTLEQSVDSLGTALSDPESLDQAADQFNELQEALRGAADDLDELNPPEDVESAHNDLVDGVRQFADDLEDVEQAARDGDLAELRDFSEGFGQSDAVKKLQEATEELQAKGVDIEGE